MAASVENRFGTVTSGNIVLGLNQTAFLLYWDFVPVWILQLPAA
jgi:hypothetical protein